MKKSDLKFDDYGKKVLNTLLRNMIGNADTTKFVWNDTLRNAELPEYMTFEKLLIEAVYLITDLGGYPTKDAILDRLHDYGVQNASESMDRLLQNHSPATGIDLENAIRQNYANFLMWYDDAQREMALDKSMSLWHSTSDMTRAERWDKISRLMNDASPVSMRRDIYFDDAERFQAFADMHQKMIERGKSAYPKFPFQKLNDKINALYPENPMLISALSKRGKSLLLAMMAEWFAWTQGLYVVVITLESDIRQWESRWWARHFGIPVNAWTGETMVMTREKAKDVPVPKFYPQIDLRNPKWAHYINQERKLEYIAQRNVAGGHIVLERAPGWAIPKMSKIVNDNQRIADRMGLQLLVAVDYLNKSVWSNLASERAKEIELMTEYSNQWKVMVEQTKIFSIMMSQETEGDGKSTETKAYGSRIPGTVFQYHLSLKRPSITVQEGRAKTKTTTPERVCDVNQKQLTDCFGRPRWYAFDEGDLSGMKAYLNIEHANDGGRGKVPLYVEGAMSNICDAETAFQTYKNDSGKIIKNPWGVREYEYIPWEIFQ